MSGIGSQKLHDKMGQGYQWKSLWIEQNTAVGAEGFATQTLPCDPRSADPSDNPSALSRAVSLSLRKKSFRNFSPLSGPNSGALCGRARASSFLSICSQLTAKTASKGFTRLLRSCPTRRRSTRYRRMEIPLVNPTSVPLPLSLAQMNN